MSFSVEGLDRTVAAWTFAAGKRVNTSGRHLDEWTKCAKQVLSGHMDTVIKTIERNVHLV